MGTIVLVCCRFALAIDKNEEMFKMENIRISILKIWFLMKIEYLGGEKENGRNRTFEIR